MKRGSTSTLKIKISGLTSEMIEDVQTIEWRFSKKGEREDNQSVYKKYPDDVDYDEETNMFYVPLTQENTLALSAGLIEYEAQINFKNKCVVKTNIVVDDSERTLGTTLISGNTPDGSIDGADIQLDVEGAVSYGKDGVTFTPHITSENNEVILSWINDGDRENPNPINIKGDKGDQGIQGEKGDKGDSPVKGVDYWTPEDIANMESDIENYVNPLLNLKADKSTTYTKTETDSLLNAKANSTDVYTKNETYNQNEIERMLNTKANAIEVYTKNETYDKDYIDRSLAYKADGNTVYTKTETDRLLEYKMNIGDAYTVADSDRLLAQKADRSEMNLLLNTKADVTSVYTKTETDNLLNAKANSSDVYSKTQADTLLANKVDVSDFENLEADVESVMLYVGYDKDVAGLCADFENNTFTRIAGSVGKSAGTDFDSWNCFGGRRRCNVADDGTINAWYGDNDFVEDGSNGQVMVYQPKFYYRVEPLKLEAQSTGIGYHLKKANYYVSDTQKAGFKLHPAFIDKNGREIDYIMFSAYEGCLYDTSAGAYITNDSQVMNTNEDKLSSIANVKPCSGSTQNLTRPNVETLAQNRGPNWHGETIKFASVNQLLCAIEYASFNFQTAIGQGVVSYASGTGNEASNTGSTSTLGNASGQATETTHVSSDNVTTIDTTAGKLSVSYRGVENIWGNIWKFEYGVNIWGDGQMNGGQPYICSDYNFAESKNSDNYVGAGFTITNTTGYIKYFGYSEDFDYLFIASEVGGTSSLPVGDYLYVISDLNAYKIARLGGVWDYGSKAGGFYWDLTYRVGGRVRNIGCRLAYTPTR